jgi:AraC-like DNA-binding protein
MTYQNMPTLHQNFMQHLRDPQFVEHLFYHLSDTILVLKNLNSQFILGTEKWLEMVGASDNREIVGKTDQDFFPKHLADLYIEEDHTVFKGHNYRNRDWLVPQKPGLISSCKVSKFVVYNRDDQICGLICQLDHWKQTLGDLQTYSDMGKVADYIQNHYREDINIEKLATLAHLSESQFHRNFKKIFKTSPLNYITKVRLNSACYDLRSTRKSVFNIAIEHGFYDNSHFAKVFKHYIGQSPGSYRKNAYHEEEKAVG